MIENNASILHYSDIFDISGKSKTIKQHSHISEICLIYYLQSGYSHKVQIRKCLSKFSKSSIWLPLI